jgi:hypothetical protein
MNNNANKDNNIDNRVIHKLFDNNDESNDTVKSLFTIIIDILKNNISSGYSSYNIYTEIKKNNKDFKCDYNEITSLCDKLTLQKYGKKLIKSGKNPPLYSINDNITTSNKRNIKEINKDNIISDSKKYAIDSDNNILKNKKTNMSNRNITSDTNIPLFDIPLFDISSNIKNNRKKALNDIIIFQYKNFIDTQNVEFLDSIEELKKIQENI